MKEKLQEYALMAEIIGSIAIVVTLIILIMNVRDNTNAIQIATIDNLTMHWSTS